MIVGIGCDSVAYEMKIYLFKALELRGFEVVDVGCDSMEPVDYPDYAYLVASGVADGKFDRGILICGTGQGMGISANKVKGVRASICYDVLSAVLSRNHNDANVLCTGAWMIEPELAERMVLAFLNVGFNGGRHQNRVEKIESIESGRFSFGERGE